MKSVKRKQCRVKYETDIFGRQVGYYGFDGREGEREGLTILEVLLRETDKKEFSFRGLRVG